MHCPLKSIKMNFNDLTRAIKYDMCNLRSFTMSTNCLCLTYQGKYEKNIKKQNNCRIKIYAKLAFSFQGELYHNVIRLVDNDKDQIYSS